MKALKIVGIICLVIIASILIVVYSQPDKAHVERSVVINAPAPVIFEEVNSFKNFSVWSPWGKMDPEAVTSFEGPSSGVGAKMNWDGKKIGQGSQWIVESVENERVKNKLIFGGYVGNFYSEIILSPEGTGTKVTWTYDGDNDNFVSKAMWVFMGGMLGSQYEEGLADLKKFIEGKPSFEQNPVEVEQDSTAI